MGEIANDFWAKWDKADELQKVKLVEELVMIKSSHKDEILKYADAVLLNSYLVDLQQYLKDKSSG